MPFTEITRGTDPYDRGEVLQPRPYPVRDQTDYLVFGEEDWGKVDFDTDEDRTLLTIRALPDGPEEDDSIDLHITTHSDRPLRIFVNGVCITYA